MSTQNINGYPLEIFTIGDDDFFDVDYYNGSSYETAKVKGSVLKAIISGGNIYNTDDSLTGNRIVTGSNFELLFQTMGKFSVHSHANNVDNIEFEVKSDPTYHGFIVKDHNTGVHMLACRNGLVEISDAYFLPGTDGTAGQVLATDGAGNVSFVTPSGASNIYNTNGTLTGNRVLDGDGSQYYLVFNNISFHGATINPPLGLTDSAILYQIDPTNIQTGDGAMLRINDSIAGVDRLNVVKDGSIIVNEDYRLPNTGGVEGSFLVTTAVASPGANTVEFKQVYNTASSQWNTTAPTTTLPSGQTANGFTFFDETTDKSTSGTSSHDEYVLSFGISITLSGTSGTADIVVGGVTYPITFNTDLFTTADDWVNTNQSALNAGGYQVFALGSGADGRIRFGAITDTGLNGITITNTSGDLSGSIANEFTGSLTASYDHVVIPYNGKPYENLRLQHYMRVNFNIDFGNENYCQLQLRRWQNDSVIGSGIPVRRYTSAQGITGQQHVFETYTNSPTDAFVTGGFYFALQNDQNSIDISGNAGILIQTNYERPLVF